MKRILMLLLLLLWIPLVGLCETVAGPDTDAGYFALACQADGTLSYKGMTLLGFRENGIQRYMLARRVREQNDYAYYDYFSGERIFNLIEDETQRQSSLRYQPVLLSSFFFDEDTYLSSISLTDILEFDWFWNLYPEASPQRYADMRAFYETIVPESQRFPRTTTLQNNPQSKIPRDRDDVLLSDLEGTAYVAYANYRDEEIVDPVFFMVESRDIEILDENGNPVSLENAVFELFTGTWLYSETYQYKNGKVDYQSEVCSYNLDYLTSIRNGAPLWESSDSTKKKPLYAVSITMAPVTWMAVDSEYIQGRKPFYAYMVPLLSRAETVGDLRMIYEMFPKENWFIPADIETPTVPIYTAPDAKTHPVSNEQEFYQAIKDAKNGDTIVILCDIRTVRPRFEIINKTLMIVGLEGTQPKIWVDRDFDDGWLSNSRHMFWIENANVTFENIVIDGGQMIRGFLAKGKSKIKFGSGVEITGCTGVFEPNKNVSLTIDGANIHHNSEFVIKRYDFPAQNEYGSGTIRFVSGEIAYNFSDFYELIDICGTKCSFVMEGGSFHDNIKTSGTQKGVISVSGNATMELTGGQIYHNISGSFVSLIDVCGATFTISGGDISGNIAAGECPSIFDIFAFSTSSSKQPTSKFVMTGGTIGDNYFGRSLYGLIQNPSLYISSELLNISSWDENSTAVFEMRGGVFAKSDRLYRIPDVFVSGKKAKLILYDGQFNPQPVTCENGGQLLDKR